MEQGASESVMEQSQMDMTIKTELEATSTVHIDREIDLNHFKHEPGHGLVHSVKIEPALLVKLEILEDNRQKDGNEQQQGTSTPAGTTSVNEACSPSLGKLLNVKRELEEVDIGPTVLQHMDIHYTINKNKSAVMDKNTIEDNCNKAMPCSAEKKQTVDDELRDNKRISRKFCCQMRTKDDYAETHLKSCLGQQKDLQQQHLMRQQRSTSSSIFESEASERTFHKLQLLNAHKKLHQQNESKTSVKTSSTVAGPSYHRRGETMKVKQKPFICDLCEKGYYSKVGLNVHKRLHSGIGLSVCHICDAKFSVKSNLVNHLRIHTGQKPYQCDTCDARFAQSGDLTQHMRIHTCEKPYQCDKCGTRFARSGYLTAHMRSHTGEKLYQCDTCDASFAKSGHLTRHMRVHTGEKPYQCDKCDACFARNSDLNNHMTVHTGEKPYQCDTCDARFARSDVLTTHMRVHTGEKPYQCDMCNVRFADRSAFSRHIRSRAHKGKKSFVCSECGAKFSCKDYLNKHIKRHHTK